MSLPARTSVARARERRCQVPECHAPACDWARIDLPAAWEASAMYTVLTVMVGACHEHARELERRSSAVLDARADLHSLLAIVDMAVSVEADLRDRLLGDGRS